MLGEEPLGKEQVASGLSLTAEGGRGVDLGGQEAECALGPEPSEQCPVDSSRACDRSHCVKMTSNGM